MFLDLFSLYCRCCHCCHRSFRRRCRHNFYRRCHRRCRGIGRPPGQMDPKAFLLQKFNVTARQQIANLLDCTSWSGAGPGLMNAVTQGALQAEKPVGGFKIGKETGEWTASNYHPYLPSENYLTCR
ncbi:hypothetical protein HN51_015134 [Arachis hypogaea]|uniref:Uncharacterized protein n=1 Tax=Arachis hypogaea TaxID=3818 RepID=A0A445CLY6_ARAHY|nr:uncharacterized protein LOC112695965 isoform X2 [Arachis hypogaea]QHO44853.1 Peptidyl-tRNA hydrolase [Arachis hypogaea]RYR51917.1 hypothetical protein Ahy_A06g026863 [Arachis hypogaea]